MRKYIPLLLLPLLLGEKNLVAQPVKYVSQMSVYLPKALKDLPLDYYYDYEEALAAGKKQNKPVILFFTNVYSSSSYGMESRVLASDGVVKRLKDNFIIALLFCDTKLPDDENYSGELRSEIQQMNTVNSRLQVAIFKNNAQPAYYLVDGNGEKIISEGYYYSTDVLKFIRWLDKGIDTFKIKKR